MIEEKMTATPVVPVTLSKEPLPWMHGLAGVAAGSISMAMFYPLDFIRTRMHTHSRSHRMKDIITEITKQEGIRKMYRGVGVAVGAHSIAWGLYLTMFRISQHQFDSIYGRRYVFFDFLSAGFAAIVTSTVITPLVLLKTRTQLSDATGRERPPKGIYKGLRHIATTEGYITLFKGLGPQILLSSQTVIHVAAYEGLKRNIWGNDQPSLQGIAVISAISKAFASALYNPLEVVRTRLNDKKNINDTGYGNMYQGFRTLLRTEGIVGLYRGVFVNVARVIPSTMVAFMLYESILPVVNRTWCESTGNNMYDVI
eukprot:Tbor_TRINITY_DN5152_c0_g3::TRINITY_DN5152_c0_g3_i1::g.25697::m.25697/K15115/SLC25A32, MFT; solute carrier family 25 (mitochondrial folate transporter), member 32